MMRGEHNPNQKRRTIYLILIIVFLIGFLVSGGILIYKFVKDNQEQKQFDDLADQVVKVEEPKEPEEPKETKEPEETPEVKKEIHVPEREIDWEALTTQCENIYAWVYIPDTDVDYPILQHPEDTDYYLRRDMYGNDATAGCIYTQNINAKDFTDRNTVVYGHNMRNGTMFRSLHKFEDDEFFDQNRYGYIYTPEKVFVYEIYGACQFNNSLLVFAYDFETEEGTNEFLDEYRNYGSDVNNIREDMEVTAEDHFLTLSTCVTDHKEMRYLVVGALAQENPVVDGKVQQIGNSEEEPGGSGEEEPDDNGEAQGN